MCNHIGMKDHSSYGIILDSMTEQELIALSKKGYFIRVGDGDKVFCPMGFILHKKSVKKNGCVRYCSKHACSICKNKCFIESDKKKWKEIDFSPNIRIKGADIADILDRKL